LGKTLPVGTLIFDDLAAIAAELIHNLSTSEFLTRMKGSALEQDGHSRNGKRHHVDTAGHQNLLFYLLLGTSSLLWCSLSFFVAPFLPFKARYRFINVYWCRCALWLSKVFLGIRYEVKGAENVPDQPCVIQSNHQSTWETFFLSAYFEPLSQVLKRSLLYVPFSAGPWPCCDRLRLTATTRKPHSSKSQRGAMSCSRMASGC
jgi:hypothetical protein